MLQFFSSPWITKIGGKSKNCLGDNGFEIREYRCENIRYLVSKRESRDQVGWIRGAQTRARRSLDEGYLYRGTQPSQKFVENVNGVRRIAFML